MKTCKNCGEQLEDSAKFCPYCGEKAEEETLIISAADLEESPVQEEETVQEEAPVQAEELTVISQEPEQPEPAEAKPVWYYVEDGQTMGPVGQSDMIAMIRQGKLTQTSYVWTSGMEDWQMLVHTALAAWLPKTAAGQNTTHQGMENHAGNSYHGASSPITARSLALYIILCFITCGIFPLYWFYVQARDFDTLLEMKGKHLFVSPAMALLLCLVTCGLFNIYFYYKVCDQLDGQTFGNYTLHLPMTLLCILSFAGSGVFSMLIAQDKINEVAAHL